MHIMDPLKSTRDTTQRRAARISTRHGEQSTLPGSMLELEAAHTREGKHTHTSPLFLHEINKFPAHKTRHGRDVHVICDACQHRVVVNLRRAEDRFSTPTSLVLTFCRNTVEVKDVRKGGEEKAQGKKRNIDSRSAKHRGERGWRTTPPYELARENKSTAATCPPHANILIFFFTLSYSKWWIKQTETAACVQPNPAALRGGSSTTSTAPTGPWEEQRGIPLLPLADLNDESPSYWIL